MASNKAFYLITEDDFVAAQRLHFRRILTRRVATNMVLLAIVLAGTSIFVDGSITLHGLGFSVFIVLAVAALIWWSIPMSARRSYNQRKMWDQLTLEWDADGLTMKSQHGDGAFRWDEFYTWAADKRTLLLYLDARLFYMLPLHAFPIRGPEFIVSALRSAGVRKI